MKIIADFSEAQSYENLPAGNYTAVIDTSDANELKVYQNSGAPYFTLKFNVTEGDYEGRTIFNNYVLKGKAAGITRTMLRTVGIAVDPKATMIEIDTNDLEGVLVNFDLNYKKGSGDREFSEIRNLKLAN